MNLVLFYGLIHAFVDATTVAVTLRAARMHDGHLVAASALVIAYDLLAFASQVFLGWLIDRWATPKSAMLTGLGLVLSSAFALPFEPVSAVVLAGCGNALFHLGAGASVLRLGLDRAFPIGLFVAPGALGLGFGTFYGKSPSLGPVFPVATGVLLAVAAVWADLAVTPARAPRARDSLQATASTPNAPTAALFLLLASIALRSLVGMSASRGYPKGGWLPLGIPVAAFLGKSLGGWVADRLGWIECSVAALLLSAPLVAFSPPNRTLLVLGLLMFQMTMPVTLTAVARLMPHRLATAFGWTCLALVLGSLPTMFSWGDLLVSRPMLFGWVLLSAATVLGGLLSAGIRPPTWLGSARAETRNS